MGNNFLLLFLFLSVSTFGQVTDFNRIVYPTDMRAKTYEEYLVQLAWQNMPENRKIERQVRIAQLEKTNMNYDWTDGISATVNLNEYTIKRVFGRSPIVDTVSSVATIDPSFNFPIFNLGANIKLSTFVQRGRKNEIADLKIDMAEDAVNQKKLMVRAEILSRYQNYLLTQEVLKARVKAEEDANSSYLLISQLFKNGLVCA